MCQHIILNSILNSENFKMHLQKRKYWIKSSKAWNIKNSYFYFTEDMLQKSEARSSKVSDQEYHNFHCRTVNININKSILEFQNNISN